MLEGEAISEANFKETVNVSFRDLTERVGLPETAKLFTDILQDAKNILLSACGYGQETINTLFARDTGGISYQRMLRRA